MKNRLDLQVGQNRGKRQHEKKLRSREPQDGNEKKNERSSPVGKKLGRDGMATLKKVKKMKRKKLRKAKRIVANKNVEWRNTTSRSKRLQEKECGSG